MSAISPKIQNQIGMLQQVQQQMQTIMSQKTQYEMEIRETRRAEEELNDVPEGAAIFMNVGTVMMQKPKEKVITSLQEKAESLELRVKSLEKQEKMMQAKFEQLQAQVKQALEGGNRPPNAA